jgi:uncharacterized membrane protein
MPEYHGPFSTVWYSTWPLIRPHKVFININILLASPVATGNGRESTDGTSLLIVDIGEVGREDRLTSFRPAFTELDFWSWEGGGRVMEGMPIDVSGAN